jgi:hypothetical protein
MPGCFVFIRWQNCIPVSGVIRICSCRIYEQTKGLLEFLYGKSMNFVVEKDGEL